MAHIRKQTRANGKTVYDVIVTFRGKQYSERVDGGKREAEALAAQREREKGRGTYNPLRRSRSNTVAAFFREWIPKRQNRNARAEQRAVELHVLPERWFSNAQMRDIRRADTDRLIERLRAKGLSDKRILNVLQPIRSMFNDALRAELVWQNPITPKRKELKTTRQVRAQIYKPSEIIALTRNETINPAARVLWSLLFYTGMRLGEAVGRKWKDFEFIEGALPQLHVHSSYEHPTTKTDRDRHVPVHPDLAVILQQWRSGEFDLHAGHAATEQDYLVPAVDGGCLNRNAARYMLEKARRQLGMPRHTRSIHAARNTFITMCRRAGANEKLVEKITHNAAGTMVDAYTEWDWEPLCRTVLLLRLEPAQALQPDTGVQGFLAASKGIEAHTDAERLPLIPYDKQGGLPLSQNRGGALIHGNSPGKRTFLAEGKPVSQGISQRKQHSARHYGLVPLDGHLLAGYFLRALQRPALAGQFGGAS